jgi:hypothetical protein
MSGVDQKTWDLFMASSHSDDDLGYPSEVTFIPSDQEWADQALRRNLVEGKATVLVGEEIELLLTPMRRSPLDWLRGRVPVTIAHRVHGHATPYTTPSSLGRHPLREIRQPAHV